MAADATLRSVSGHGKPSSDLVQQDAVSLGQEAAYLLMEDWMFVASEEATAGSVMAKQLLIWPHSRGSSHCFFCFTVPYLRGSYC